MIADALKIAGAVFVLAIMQVSMTPQVSDALGGPDLMLVLVVALALLRGVEAAALAGFAGGVLLDGMLFEPLGLTSLVLVMVALAVGRIAGRLDRPSVSRAFLLVVVAAPIAQAAHALVGAGVGEGYPIGYALSATVVPTAVQTAVVALPLLAGLYRLFGPAPTRADVSPVVPA